MADDPSSFMCQETGSLCPRSNVSVWQEPDFHHRCREKLSEDQLQALEDQKIKQ